jgi:hypothetical protein
MGNLYKFIECRKNLQNKFLLICSAGQALTAECNAYDPNIVLCNYI